MSTRREVLQDPTLSIVFPDTLVRADGTPIPHDMGTAISVGANLLGSAMQSDAAGDAASAQAGATAGATAEQRRQFDQIRADQTPWRDTGSSAIRRLAVLMGLSPTSAGTAADRPVDRYVLQDFLDYNKRAAPAWYQAEGPQATDAQIQFDRYQRGEDWKADDFKRLGFRDLGAPGSTEAGYGDLTKQFSVSDFWNDPVISLGYQTGLDLGTKALRNAAPLTTGLDSGAALKELTKFGTDYTGMKAGESRGRFIEDQTNQFNRLAGIAGVGQTAANTTAQAGMNMANNVSNLTSALGNAQGAARIAQGNAWGGGLQSIGNYWRQREMMNRMMGGGSGSIFQTPDFNPGSSYDSGGSFTPYYSGFGSGGDYQYG